tara:strand:+ start:1101 stop:2492 length:1392 start_codon:yes stop_codon:yes gene_type:complete
MFKKIEIWILYLVIVLAIIFGIFFGVLVRQELVGSVKLGSVSRAALFLSEIPMNLKKIFQLTKDPGVESSVGSRFEKKYGFIGNYNDDYFLLLSRFDGDSSESLVELVDLGNFKIIHQWNPNINEINENIDVNRQEYKLLKRDFHENRYKIDSPILSEDGGLIFHPNGSALIKIDHCNNLLWINDSDHFHHMSEEDLEGNYWIPSRIFPYSLSEEMVGEEYGDFFDDAITKVSQEGKTIYQKSVSKILLDNDMHHLIFSNQIFDGDPIHLNDIQPAVFSSQYWEKGDLFLSLRTQNMIIQYRPSKNLIIDIITGPFANQHDVDIISSEEISIFNNNVYFYKGKRIDGGNLHFNGKPKTGISEVLIYNFRTKTFKKKFNDQFKQYDIRTSVQGLSEILNDGSLFIEETQAGRLLFFNKNGELLWEYVNKAENGKNYGLGFSRILYKSPKIDNVIKKIKSHKCKS